jgi:hypothetical protein
VKAYLQKKRATRKSLSPVYIRDLQALRVLNSAQQYKHEQNHYDQSEPAARIVAPTAAVRPSRQCSQRDQQQDHHKQGYHFRPPRAGDHSLYRDRRMRLANNFTLIQNRKAKMNNRVLSVPWQRIAVRDHDDGFHPRVCGKATQRPQPLKHTLQNGWYVFAKTGY